MFEKMTDGDVMVYLRNTILALSQMESGGLRHRPELSKDSRQHATMIISLA